MQLRVAVLARENEQNGWQIILASGTEFDTIVLRRKHRSDQKHCVKLRGCSVPLAKNF